MDWYFNVGCGRSRIADQTERNPGGWVAVWYPGRFPRSCVAQNAATFGVASRWDASLAVAEPTVGKTGAATFAAGSFEAGSFEAGSFAVLCPAVAEPVVGTTAIETSAAQYSETGQIAAAGPIGKTEVA